MADAVWRRRPYVPPRKICGKRAEQRVLQRGEAGLRPHWHIRAQGGLSSGNSAQLRQNQLDLFVGFKHLRTSPMEGNADRRAVHAEVAERLSGLEVVVDVSPHSDQVAPAECVADTADRLPG